MADLPYIAMDPSPVSEGFSNINVYEKELVISGAESETKALIIPADVQEIAVTVEPRDNATATVYTTTDIYNKVLGGDPGVTWVEWSNREVTAITQDACTNVTALRFQRIKPGESGSVKITVRAQ